MPSGNRLTLFPNGREALSGSDCTTAFQTDMRGLLTAGDNVLCILATNGGRGPNEAEVLGLLELQFAEGGSACVCTDGSGTTSEQLVTGRPTSEFNDAEWPAAHVPRPNGMKPWGQVALVEHPLPLFCRDFAVGKPVHRTIVFVSSLGQDELRLNGDQVGGTVMDPGWTEYRKTCFFSAHDVTETLLRGRNAIGLMLGNGRYKVEGGRYVKFKGRFDSPKLIMQVRIEYSDGSSGLVYVYSSRGGQRDVDTALFSPGFSPCAG